MIMELYSWIVVVTTNKEHISLLDYIFENKGDVYLGVDIVFDGALKRKDGRLIGENSKKMLLITFTTKTKNYFKDIIEKSIINSNAIISVDNDIDEDEFFIEDETELLKKGKSFENERKLLKYLDQIDFRFDDDSLLFEFFLSIFLLIFYLCFKRVRTTQNFIVSYPVIQLLSTLYEYN